MARKRTSSPLPSRWALKHGAYYYRTRLEDRVSFEGKTWFRLSDNYPDALRAFAARKELATGDTLSSVIDRYRVEILPLRAPNTQSGYGAALDLLSATLGSNPCKLIEPQLVYQYIDAVARERTMNVANIQIKVLNVILDKAVRWGIISKNVIKGEVKPFGKRDGLVMARERYVQDEELAAWQEKATPVQKAFAALVMLTGARKSDILQLVLPDIREDGLNVQDRKNNKTTLYRWTSALREAVELAMSIRKGDSIFLLTNRKGLCFVDKDDRTEPFDKMWRNTIQKAINDPNNKLEKSFSRHDLRAKVGSDADTEQRAQQLLGHSTAAMTKRHYRRAPRVVDPTK